MKFSINIRSFIFEFTGSALFVRLPWIGEGYIGRDEVHFDGWQEVRRLAEKRCHGLNLPLEV